MARRNQQAQKRPRPTKKQPTRQPQKQTKQKSPGTSKRPQWLKDVKTRLSKPSCSSAFEQKSKAAALQQTRESESRADRKLRYSSSSDIKSFTSINKDKLQFSPTLKIHNIDADSPGTPPFVIITSSDPNDFMIDNNEQTQASTTDHQLGPVSQPSQSSCGYSPPIEKRPQGIMKSTPRMDKIVSKIWKEPNHEVNTKDDSSTEVFPIQPPIKKIELVYLDTTTSDNTTNADVPIVEITDDTPPANEEEPPANNEEHTASEEEHRTPATSPAKSSTSSIHASDFYNQDEF